MTDSFFGLTINPFLLQDCPAGFPESRGTPDFHKSSLATTITNLRLGLGMSPRELCDKADIDYSTYKKIVNPVEGKPYSPRLATLKKIAGALGVSVGELFDHQDNRKRRCPKCKHKHKCKYRADMLTTLEQMTQTSMFVLDKLIFVLIALANACKEFEVKEEG